MNNIINIIQRQVKKEDESSKENYIKTIKIKSSDKIIDKEIKENHVNI